MNLIGATVSDHHLSTGFPSSSCRTYAFAQLLRKELNRVVVVDKNGTEPGAVATLALRRIVGGIS